MNGLKRILFRIIPFVILFSFIGYGITIIFVTENITYLSTITINGQTMQYFDIASYLRGITARPLIDGFTKVFTIQPWVTQIENFSRIWENGYDLFDVVKSVVAGFLMIANFFILIYNCCTLPARMLAGLILTIFSIAGINITANTPIVTIMKSIIAYYQVPFINIVIS